MIAPPVLVLSLALLPACRDKGGDSGEHALAPFPDDFKWGAAVAGFQVDAGCPTIPAEECEDRNSDWYQWVTDAELVGESGLYLSGQPLSEAPGHWELYDEDFARAEDLGLTSMRVSIEWSRLFPTDPGEATAEELGDWADPAAVAAYHAYFASIRAHGMEPLVTLNHYTLPLWLHDGKACHQDWETCENRGWLDPDRLIPAIAAYSGYCAIEFGDEIDWWATLNEPFAVVLAGYTLPSEDRSNPPGIVEPAVAFDVLFSMMEAHAAMYDAVHAFDSVAQVGAVPNLSAVQPDDPANELDVTGTEHLDYIYNRVFLDATVDGLWDRDLDGVPEETRDDLRGRMDYIGINYYTRITVKGLTIPLVSQYPYTDFLPLVMWEEYPEGIAEVSLLAGEYGVPVLITETGTPDLDDAADRFLQPHLLALQEAMEGGLDLRGFHFWSLIDNYEWNHGMSMEFGLYDVDNDTKGRTLRPVGERYSKIISAKTAE